MPEITFSFDHEDPQMILELRNSLNLASVYTTKGLRYPIGFRNGILLAKPWWVHSLLWSPEDDCESPWVLSKVSISPRRIERNE
jgi:hypothetical protein